MHLHLKDKTLITNGLYYTRGQVYRSGPTEYYVTGAHKPELHTETMPVEYDSSTLFAGISVRNTPGKLTNQFTFNLTPYFDEISTPKSRLQGLFNNHLVPEAIRDEIQTILTDHRRVNFEIINIADTAAWMEQKVLSSENVSSIEDMLPEAMRLSHPYPGIEVHWDRIFEGNLLSGTICRLGDIQFLNSTWYLEEL